VAERALSPGRAAANGDGPSPTRRESVFRLKQIIARIPSAIAAAHATMLGRTTQPGSGRLTGSVPLSISKADPRPTNPWDDAEEWEQRGCDEWEAP
jgi:hypothetical protein